MIRTPLVGVVLLALAGCGPDSPETTEEIAASGGSSGAAADSADTTAPQIVGTPVNLVLSGFHTNINETDPSKAAWQLFVALNQPVHPDTVVWETWPSAAYVFGDPNREIEWPGDRSRRVLDLMPVQQTLFQDVIRDQSEREGRPTPRFEPVPRSEVRMNRAAFQWIKTFNMWYLRDTRQSDYMGQEGHYEAYKDGVIPDVSLPYGSITIKAAWIPIPDSLRAGYFTRTVDDTLFGLNAFHIAAKNLPNWFWATWENVRNPRREAVTYPDTYGLIAGTNLVSPELIAYFENAGMDTSLWNQYRLNGTQTNFTDAQGHPTRLANSVLEAGFTARSSCMTCHARSTIGKDADRLDAFEHIHMGTPHPHWFSGREDTTAKKYLQLDFMWSFARAKARTRD